MHIFGLFSVLIASISGSVDPGNPVGNVHGQKRPYWVLGHFLVFFRLDCNSGGFY